MRNSILTAFVVFGFSLSSIAQIPNYIPTDSLIAWWPFNGNAQDESVNNNNGIVSGATLTTDRNNVANSAYDFDGINDFIEVLHHPSLNCGLEPYTFSLWARPNQFVAYAQWLMTKARTQAPDSQQFRMAIEKSNNPSDGHYYFATGAIDSNGTWWSNTGGYILQSDSIAKLNEWTLLTVVRIGIDYWLYVNGVLHSTDSSYLGRIQDLSTNLNNFVFGAEMQVTGTGKLAFFKGKIDDIGLWKRALSPWEIKNLYCPPDSSSISVTACDSFVSPSGNYTWDSSGVYSDTLVNHGGCDSVVYITLTIHQTPTIWLGWNEERCDPGHLDLLAYSNIGILNWYDSLTGLQVLDTGSYFHTPFLDSSRHFWVEAINQGCNSQRIPVSAGVIYSDSVFIDTSVCDQYIAPDSTVLNTTGIHIVKLKKSTGCDSVITINLNVIDIDTSVYDNDPIWPDSIFSAELNADSYQWLDCFDNFQIIPGDTGRGKKLITFWGWRESYAVAIQKENCADTSSCHFYLIPGVDENSKSQISIFPNPSTNSVWIKCTPPLIGKSFSIADINGRTLIEGKLSSTQEQVEISQLIPGLYFFHLKGETAKSFKLLKQ